ncbi:MAG: D-alanyl-D-alanine carboxypeptidase [Alicyclobacillus macrosporangiidus]|uniref:D-alanyl-D-alanine carboxypeptidase family protein n=1 Tax=Alicyclobacillus macrosporangiidus TaxID=392015 RepID=UPI0026EEE0BE|nr:D-alanyl-D-alanine carboxypeptidase family protein [Alicyclobacillus macrosporangiidus]MCL6597984.1 D-alanyl-D-alanine carboxypeptidase [Alicyclobacillus macrosporangiidus]
MGRGVRRGWPAAGALALLCCLVPGTAGAQSFPAAVGGSSWAAGHGTAAAASVEIRPVREPQPDAEDEGIGLAHESRAAVVMDYATGKVLFEKDAHEKLPMASITKVMTLLLVAEAIDSGRLRLTDKVKTSEYAASMGGSQVFLEPGETMTVEDLVKGIAIASANDACVALAEHLAGSEEAFVRQMNRRARELGMDDTHFVNCNGLPEPDHYSSAHDIAIMSRELLKHEWITKYTSVYSDYLRKDTEHPFWLVNTNKLVRFYPGVDGLKTGYTAEAKYCLTATAKKDGFRVIAVVMGAPKPSVRNREVSELLNWSFSTFTSKVLYKAGQQVATVHVLHGTPETIPVVTSDTVGVIYKRGEHPSLQTQMAIDDLQAPVKPGQVVGELKVVDGEDVVGSCHLVAGTGARKAGLFETLGRTVRGMVTFGR